ncbi:MAG: hypothetical protein BVN34_08600 [Proteobacteria bacterium ST_bin12]|nr:MAG: hypothetical protein BVN34_08600 [Proteobacteria bacterium ST_bin12]
MIIFLDFDGVLHPDAVFKPAKKPIELRTHGQLMMHAKVLEDILKPFDTSIVLSTSWVRSIGFYKTVKSMPSALASRVIGATWHSNMVDKTVYPYASGQYTADPFNHWSRFQQIEYYVVRNSVKNWLAIDDLHSGQEIEKWPVNMLNHLVLTDGVKGLVCIDTQLELINKILKECGALENS